MGVIPQSVGEREGDGRAGQSDSPRRSQSDRGTELFVKGAAIEEKMRPCWATVAPMFVNKYLSYWPRTQKEPQWPTRNHRTMRIMASRLSGSSTSRLAADSRHGSVKWTTRSSPGGGHTCIVRQIRGYSHLAAGAGLYQPKAISAIFRGSSLGNWERNAGGMAIGGAE